MSARSPRLLGTLMIVAGVLLHKRAVEQVVSHDEFIHSPAKMAVIAAGQLFLIVAGILLFRRGAWRWPAWVRIPGILGLLAAIALGALGNVRRMGWMEPPVRTVAELCEFLSSPDDPFFGTGRVRELQRELATLGEGPEDDPGRATLLADLAKQLLRHGRIDEAIETLETAFHLESRDTFPLELVNRLRHDLGVAHFRRGERNHCIGHHNPQACIFPLRGGGLHVDPAPATHAMEYFRAYLEDDPDDLGVQWILHLAAMASGQLETMDADPAFLASTQSVGTGVAHWRNIAPELGMNDFNLLGGAVLDDLDRDGFLDVVTSTYAPCGRALYYHNNGDGTFDDWSERSGIADQIGAFNIASADYDGDGRLDLLFIRGAWMGVRGRSINTLLRQNIDGTFTDVTHEAGLGKVAYPTLTAAWADYDNDGDMDLYVGNDLLTPNRVAPSQLFRNNGDGTFTDVARRAGVRNFRSVKGLNWGDYDNDGDPDLFVSNYFARNRLYRNEGDGTFLDVAPELGVDHDPPTDRTLPVWFWDQDNDGWLDLFVGGYGPTSLSDVTANYLDATSNAEPLRLYRNDGAGGFQEITRDAGLDHVRAPMGANYGDIDNDGRLDIYLGTGGWEFDHLLPNVLYHNRGDRFDDVTVATGLGHLQKGHGIAFGDIDNDGDQDIFAQMGGFAPDDTFANALFLNPGTPNHWLTVRLVGVQSNRFGVGARIRVDINDAGQERSIHLVSGGGGSFGASSLQEEIGLGQAARIRELEIWWPASGVRQTFRDLPVDEVIEITEGQESYRTLKLQPVPLPGGGDAIPPPNPEKPTR